MPSSKNIVERIAEDIDRSENSIAKIGSSRKWKLLLSAFPSFVCLDFDKKTKERNVGNKGLPDADDIVVDYPAVVVEQAPMMGIFTMNEWRSFSWRQRKHNLCI